MSYKIASDYEKMRLKSNVDRSGQISMEGMNSITNLATVPMTIGGVLAFSGLASGASRLMNRTKKMGPMVAKRKSTN